MDKIKRAKEALKSIHLNLEITRKDVARCRELAKSSQQGNLVHSQSVPPRTVSDVLRIGTQAAQRTPVSSPGRGSRSPSSPSSRRSPKRGDGGTWRPLAALPRSHVAPEQLAQRIENMSMSDLVHEWDKSRFWGPPMTCHVVKFLHKHKDRGRLLAASCHIYKAFLQHKAEKRRSLFGIEILEMQKLNADKFAPNAQWAHGRSIVPLPGTRLSAVPMTVTGAGHWNPAMKEARHKIMSGHGNGMIENNEATVPGAAMNGAPKSKENPTLHVMEVAALAQTLNHARKTLGDKHAQTLNHAPSMRSPINSRYRNNPRRKAPQNNIFKDFLVEHQGGQRVPTERFANQAKALAADPRMLHVYMNAMRSRSQGQIDRERTMDDQTLFENSKLFHGSNYRILGKESPGPAWGGPQDVRELIVMERHIMDYYATNRSRPDRLVKFGPNVTPGGNTQIFQDSLVEQVHKFGHK